MQDRLVNIRTLLELDVGERDDILQVLLTYAESTVALYVGTSSIPPALTWIAEQMVVRKYNRLGDEGLKSSNYEGISLEYEDSDLEPFQDLLDRFVELNPIDTVKRGRLKML